MNSLNIILTATTSRSNKWKWSLTGRHSAFTCASRSIGGHSAPSWLLTNHKCQTGTGALSFPDAADDPIVRLEPVKITSALYGTLDDFYPESIRVLKDLK